MLVLTHFIAIDATRDRDALDCVRAHYAGTVDHPRTADAMSHLRSANSQIPELWLVGHGTVAGINTGDGKAFPVHPDRFVALGNEPDWINLVPVLPVKVLRLWSCHTATNPTGCELLRYLAVRSGALVYGVDGLAHCGPNGLFLDSAARWRDSEHCLQDGRPPTIPLNDEMKIVLVEVGNARKSVPVTTLELVRYSRNSGSEEGGSVELRDPETTDLVRHIRLDEPYEPGGPPLACVSGRLEFHFDTEVRSFLLRSDLLLQDEASPGIFYRGAAGLPELLRRFQG
jgi:hypothetical protein